MQNLPSEPQNQNTFKTLSREHLLSVIAQQDTDLKTHQQRIQEQANYIQILEEYLRLATVKKFCASSEKLPFQADLFDEAELEVALSDLEDQLPDDDQTGGSGSKKKRNRDFSDTLPRKRIELLLSDEERAGAERSFFSKVKEELEYIPAQLNVLEYWQEKAVFRSEDSAGEPAEQIVAAQRPVHPLGKCFASPSLLTYILVAKYADGLPLYRLEGMFRRYDAEISRSNMAQWMIKLADVFQPLINLMRECQNSSRYIHADETRIQVLKEDGKTAQSDKWMWVTCGGPPRQPLILFEYDPSRSGQVAERILDGFQGILQADGYSGYASVCRQNHIQRIGCWDHARRKFVEAVKATDSKKKQGKASKADVALSKIRKLYRIEKEIKEYDETDRYRIRQQQSLPILHDFKKWLEYNLGKVMKSSLTRKAMEYTLNQWEYLIGYCDHGYLSISNARAENAIRPFAVGRKAWLFADTPQGARASAICYSLVETAKANQIEPYSYIEYILNQIGAADTLEKIEALLPCNVPGEHVKKITPRSKGVGRSV